MVKGGDGPVIPRPGEGKRGEAGYLGYLLRQAGGAYRLRVERALADLAVTPAQFTALTMVAAYPGLSSADLARLAVLTPQTVSVIVANLERAGSVLRRPHPVHGRILTVAITDSGQALLARCRERVQVLEKQLAAGLSPEEEAVIRRWLVAVAAEGGEVDADQPA
ncbi:MAG: MarR family transcriptional regulator [Inquilinus limosus]|uniref:MarR family transcriptional regulator n=1 Tax=Inquilinus limosus TaxID=171674 RepID=A0A952KNS7_9PROT|nr:MarR family transcriptional regulator [Inquilinus limosus]